MSCLQGLKLLDSNGIDLICTSPPYKDSDGFSYSFLKDVFNECYYVQKDNSLLFLNFGHLANQKSRPFKLVLMLEEIGYNFLETFIWVKNHYKPIQGKRRVNNLFEYVFMFSKGNCPELNRLSIGVEYKDITNAKRFNKGINLRCRGNLWHIPYETIQSKEDKLHPDRYPLGLPENAIKLSNIYRESLVLDPFSGSASTAVAAKKLGMNYIGFEINKNYFEVGEKRLLND